MNDSSMQTPANSNREPDFTSVMSAIHDVTAFSLAIDHASAAAALDRAYVTALGIAAFGNLSLPSASSDPWHERLKTEDGIVAEVINDLMRIKDTKATFSAAFHVGWALAGIRRLGTMRGHDVPASVSRLLSRQAA